LAFHVVLFSAFPSLPAVMSFLSLPVKRVRLHFTERPAYRQPVGVSTVQDYAIAFTSSLRHDDVVELRIYKNDAPLLEGRVEKPNRCSDRAFLLVLAWIADPKVLYCVAVHDRAEQELAFFMKNGSVGAIEREVGIPTANETVKGFGFVANRRIRTLRPEHINHCLSRRFRESLFRLSARPFLRAALATQHNCRHENDEHDHWISTSSSHG